MIDHHDGDMMWAASLGAPGWVGLALLAVAGVLWLVADSNESECESRRCPGAETARLLEGECLCVGVAP